MNQIGDTDAYITESALAQLAEALLIAASRLRDKDCKQLPRTVSVAGADQRALKALQVFLEGAL